MTAGTHVTIRPFQTADYPAYARVHQAHWSDAPTTPELRRHEDETRPPILEYRGFVAEAEGQPVAFGSVLNALWYAGERNRFFAYCIEPAYAGSHVETEFVRYLVEEASRDARCLFCSCEDRHAHQRELLESSGFTMQSRMPVTAIDLAAFGPANQAKDGSVEIRTLANLREHSDWLERFHALRTEIERDLPGPAAFEPTPFEVIRDYVTDPLKFDVEGSFIALDGGRWVGLTEIVRTPADPTLGKTGLTGVVRSHRRHGIATALKVRALRWAKDLGVRRVTTDNEENNPMLQLNYQLGFRDAYAYLHYTKHVG